MWPVWYDSANFAGIRGDTLGREAARTRVRDLAQATPYISRAWAERAVMLALDGRSPRVRDIALTIELKQICLVINRGGLVLVTNGGASEAEGAALVHALEWMTRNARLAAVVLFETLPEGNLVYDRILQGAKIVAVADSSSAPAHEAVAPAWLAPVEGMPHPLSATEQRLAKAIALDPSSRRSLATICSWRQCAAAGPRSISFGAWAG
jgi:hypothetical protein